MLVEILSGVLPGAGVRHGVGRMYEELERKQDVGSFHLALDPERFVGLGPFRSVLSGMLRDLKAIPPAEGFDEVLVPGEPEARAQAARERRRRPAHRRSVGTMSELRPPGLAVTPPTVERAGCLPACGSYWRSPSG